MFISRREYALLTDQLEYFRTKYEEERGRADRLTNNLLQTNGLPPATALEVRGLDGDVDLGKKRTFMERYVAELFSEEITDKVTDDESVAEDIGSK